MGICSSENGVDREPKVLLIGWLWLCRVGFVSVSKQSMYMKDKWMRAISWETGLTGLENHDINIIIESNPNSRIKNKVLFCTKIANV